MSYCGSLKPRILAPPPPPPSLPVVLSGSEHGEPGSDTVIKPAGVVNGTVLVACVGSDVDVITPPLGFAQSGDALYFDNVFAGFSWSVKLYQKTVVDAGSEPASYQFTDAFYTDIWMVALNNAISIGDQTGRPVSPTTEVGTIANGASCAIFNDGALLLRFEASNSANRDTNPAGMTPLPGSPFDTTFNADYKTNLVAGVTGDLDTTYLVNQTWAVFMVVIEPLP